MRHEDLLHRPDSLVDALATVLRAGYQIASRQETLRREAEAVEAFSDDVKLTIIVRLISGGCQAQMQALGYAMLGKQSSGTAASASLHAIDAPPESATSSGSAWRPPKQEPAEDVSLPPKKVSRAAFVLSTGEGVSRPPQTVPRASLHPNGWAGVDDVAHEVKE